MKIQTSQNTVINLDTTPVSDLRDMYTRAFANRNYANAFVLCVNCVNRQPQNPVHILSLNTIVKEINLQSFQIPVKNALLHGIKSPLVERQFFFRPWRTTIMNDPMHTGFKQLCEVHSYEAFKGRITRLNLSISVNDEFFIKGIETLIFNDPDLERVMTFIRRFCLESAQDLTRIKQTFPLSFIAALGHQCFMNEYIYPESEEERYLLQKIVTEDAYCDNPYILGLLGAYQPLSSYRRDEIFIKYAKEHADLSLVIEQQILDKKQEIALKQTIKPLAKIQNKTSRAVQTMYEENPYPRWNSISIFPNPAPKVKGRYLVAGCGTCKATLQFATKFPNLDITVVDLSQASLAYGMRKAKALGANNLTFYHGDLIDLPLLNQQFDAIDCSGVLHHMKDPVKGWQAIINVLAPGGRMQIGLYSRSARQDVWAARDIVKEKGYKATPEDIKALRQDIIARTDEAHPAKRVIQRNDFYSLSQCRDLIFHVQEHVYTLERLKEEMESLDLEFLGFKLPSQKMESLYNQTFPEEDTVCNLDNWAQLEEQHPFMFSGMYQFVCCKKDDKDTPNISWQDIMKSNMFRINGSPERNWHENSY